MQEVKAVKLAIMTFTITKEKLISINVKIDNMVALSYLMNIGDKKRQELVIIGTKIWDYHLLRKMAITTEYLPRVLNVEAEWESRDLRDSNQCKLDP